MVFQEPLLKHEQNRLYKPDLVFVKGNQALAVDITIRYESKPTSLVDVVAEKVRKYHHLGEHSSILEFDKIINFKRSPLEACGKWYQGNYKY